ncbi:hypothetical protein TNCV_2398151 [Trichonephila clavipes]|uniref:Uncharacterized protein n=1 Tax=Trichonephila clavipes TaxID=2585209 RepID=A0A8X6VRU7_TRICX|nr:hypothetical protein TNCV_2398151 [Trichonephila clavipes]
MSPSIVPLGNFAELNCTVLSPVWCSRPTTGVPLAPCHDEFRGPRSDYVRQMALETTTTTEHWYWSTTVVLQLCSMEPWGSARHTQEFLESQ